MNSSAEDLPNAEWNQALRRRLKSWFARNARELPWRNTSDPYLVWISEIMLQQTQVATVIPYFERFAERFPNPKSLAEASEDEVLRYWEGLGYYRRARQLHKAAAQIVAQHGGRFPIDFEEVLALPGVGRYTAGAILSIACGQRLPIVEANTNRLYARLLAHREEVATADSQKRFWRFAESILPRNNCGQFNQALMELGAEICKPKSPDCENCPIRMQCPTFEHSLQAEIPAAKRKTAFEDRREAALVLRRGERFLLRRCGESERWAGLWDFPRFQVQLTTSNTARELQEGARQLLAVEILPGHKLLSLKHGVTKYRIRLDCYEAQLIDNEGPACDEQTLRWLTMEQLAETPLSTTGRQLVEHLRVQASAAATTTKRR